MIYEPNVFEITVREVLAWSSRYSIINKIFRIYLNPLMPVDNKKVTSMRDLFVINRH